MGNVAIVNGKRRDKKCTRMYIKYTALDLKNTFEIFTSPDMIFNVQRNYFPITLLI